MLDWLTSIGDSFSVAIQFITSTITGIINAFQLIGQSFVFLGTAHNFLPLPLRIFVLTGLTIGVVYFLIDR